MKSRTMNAMKATALFAAVGALSWTVWAAEAPEYKGSRFADVWSTVRSDPYALPHNAVTVGSFAGWFRDKLAEAADRTVTSRDDLLPQFTKLVHPNGMCWRGTWTITENTPYTGYLKRGASGLIIARTSVALTETERGSKRGFGFAGKIFPTLDPQHSQPLETANFFAIDTLTGANTDHYLDATMTNKPAVGLPASISEGVVGAWAARAFSSVDSHPGERQVYPIAELGEPAGKPSAWPVRMAIRGATPPADARDFREELAQTAQHGPLRFEILAGQDSDSLAAIGIIELTEGVVSNSCDHRLHFTHAKWRDDVDGE